jgi:mRNA interferase MazF
MGMVIARGSIWWGDFGSPRGSAPAWRRPVVVVSADQYNASRLRTVIVATLTANLRRAALPGNVAIPAEISGLPQDSVVNVTQLVTVDRDDLEEHVGTLPDWVTEQIDAGLRRVLGLDRPGALLR